MIYETGFKRIIASTNAKSVKIRQIKLLIGEKHDGCTE